MPVSNIIERRRRERNNSIMQFPDDLGAHSMLLVFKKYEYKKPGTRQLNKVTNETLSSANLSGASNIMLPLPTNLQDSFNVRVQRFDQEIGGELIASAAAGAKGMGDLSMGQLTGALAAAIPGIDLSGYTGDNFTEQLSKDAAFLGRRTIDKTFSGASKNIDAGLGSTVNPKAALVFEGVELKTHNFTWTFAPRSENESTMLRDIGNTIKRNILPSYGDVGGGAISRALLNYPSTVDVFFFGIDPSYFMYFKTCMVTTFDINFTPEGLTILKGGKPAVISMSMSLIESDIHTAEDYDGSGTSIQADFSDLMADPNGSAPGR